MTDKTLTDFRFAQFDELHPSLLQGLHDTGFERCTPIQALTLPLALQGHDVAGQAQTGTGKTCAFLVALFNTLLQKPARPTRKDSDPRAIVMAPTRELAIQIDKDARAIARHTGLRIALIYGGVDYAKQREQLRDGCDLIIATPGRLIDYHKQHVFSFRSVDVFVLDEADRMFDLGFIKDVRFLLRRLPPRQERQGMLFSATLSYRVLELAYEHMNNPQKLAVESTSVTASRVRQSVYFPASDEKLPLLIGMLTRMDAWRSMVFVNTKSAAEKIARGMERAGFRVAVLSGDVPQRKRETLLNRFARGELSILVATDVAARGLHIPDVSHVFNYDLPNDAEDYVHRIGRTARLGAEGDAISFACETYAVALPDIEKYIEQKIPVAQIESSWLKPGMTPAEVQAKFAPKSDDPNAHAPADRGLDPEDRERASRQQQKKRGDSGRGFADRNGPKIRNSTGRREPARESNGRSEPARENSSGSDPAREQANTTASSPTDTEGLKKRRRRRKRSGSRSDASGAPANGAELGTIKDANSNSAPNNLPKSE